MQLQGRSLEAVAWILIVFVGAVLRFGATFQNSFPLGDGGLFFAAIEAIRTHGGIPEAIPYNGGIPFVYPPLGLLLSAVLSSLPSVGTESVLRLVPPLLATAVLALVPWTASRFVGSVRAGLIAATMVALMPQAYDQLVAGGGVTRGLSVLLALAALGFAAGGKSTSKRALLTGLLLGLTGLTHPRVAIFALASIAFVWWRGRHQLDRREIPTTLLVAGLMALPWLAMVAWRGQLDALIAAGQRFDPVVGLVGLLAYPAMETMHGGIPNVATAASVAGVGTLLVFGRWSLPTWLLLVHVLGCPPFLSPVAWAMAGASGIDLLASRMDLEAHSRVRWPRVVGASVVLVVAIASANAGRDDPGSKQQALTRPQIDAASAVAALPDGARIAVVTSETWGNDLIGEWLPVLSGHRVVTTPQGAEWLGSTEFIRRVRAHEAGQACHALTSECIAAAISRNELPATHVLIPRGRVAGSRGPSECCSALVETIRHDERFHILVDEPGALIAEWGKVNGP